MIARLPGFEIAIGIPTEEDRVQSDPQEIETYFELLESILIDFPADMAVNLDETDHCDWVNARADPLIVPEEFSGVKVPVQRNSKRSTSLAAITAGGSQLKPLAIIHRDTIQLELYESGFTPGCVYYRTQDNAFIV
jgi:hypothetical protein